jgi:hypothetical protein
VQGAAPLQCTPASASSGAGLGYTRSINGGAQYTNTTGVALALTAPAGTGCMQVSNTGGFEGAVWEPYAPQKAWQLDRYRDEVLQSLVFARFQDTSGVISVPIVDSIILDVHPPTDQASFGGAGPTSDARPVTSGRTGNAPRAPVTLQLNATDDRSGVVDMRLSNRYGFAGAVWEPYTTNRAWDLGTATTLYAQFRDRAGNVSEIYPAALPGTVICAPRPPVSVSTVAAGGGLQVTIAASGANNTVQVLEFGAATNALIDVPGGQTGQTGNFTLNLPAGTAQTTFSVRRATAGQAMTVPLVVTDACGPWSTFVGAGSGSVLNAR